MQLSVAEAAHLLQVSEDTVYRWIRDRGMPASQFDGRFHFNRVWLLEWAHDKGISVALESDEGMPSLSQALRCGGQHRDIPGSSKAQVLQNCVRRLPLPPDTDREYLLEMLCAREEQGSTGFGGGIAIPHSRGPILLHVHAPLVALCHLREPVEFGAHDGKPVTALFVEVTPTVRMHLHLLAGIARALSDSELSALIREGAEMARIVERVGQIESAPRQPAPVRARA